MRRPIALFVALLCLGLFLPGSAFAAFGIKELSVEATKENGEPETVAGSHPFAFTTEIFFNTTIDPGSGKEIPEDEVKDVIATLPAGFAGNPKAVPTCSTADFLDINTETVLPACSNESVVGATSLVVGYFEPGFMNAPVYNLDPPPGVPAKLGFIALGGLPVTIEPSLNTTQPYNLVATVSEIPQAIRIYGTKLTLWGDPSSEAHDPFRGSCLATPDTPPKDVFASKGNCPVPRTDKAFLTLPRSCGGPFNTHFETDSWQNPGAWLEADPIAPLQIEGCENLEFKPEIGAKPTTAAAESPTGLAFDLAFDDPGIIDPQGIAQTDIKKAVVTLPEGVTVNPSSAVGLGVCTPADFARETVEAEFGDGCPLDSKVGDVEVETPILEGSTLKGSVYVAQPNDPGAPGAENPFDSLIALYMVIKDPGLGVLVKLPGRVETDPNTGRLTTTFDEVPQVPVGKLRFRFREGPRAPLATPSGCGDFTAQAVFTPWSGGAAVTKTASFSIGGGPNGGGCPAPGGGPLNPGFSAGTADNTAGAHSPFQLHLTRRDGEGDLVRLDTVLPQGLTAKIAGVGKCPDSALAVAALKTGRSELAAPTCPASSRLGSVVAGAGVGPVLNYVPGTIYFAGPYNGAPLSLAVVVPAVAGPFDLGTVVTRQALVVDPVTGQARIDGSRSDPLPRILDGIPLKVRDIRVAIDRPGFMLNATSCEPGAIAATVFGNFLAPFAAPAAASGGASARYQAQACGRLGFKPRLSLTLKGGTRRNQYPAVIATLRPRAGDANASRVAVTFPRSAFLEQGHIRTICTRVQFAANACPKRSIYGRAQAFSPLLDEPLSGPVYLRSSDNPLPDLVLDLSGTIDFHAAIRIDSVNRRLRSTVDFVPDLPISKVVLRMQGGKKGLIVNSKNLCIRPPKAKVAFRAYNGKRATLRPAVKAPGCKKGKKKGGGKQGGRKR